MGLGVTLSNALSGMRTTQDGLTVLSRNVANAGNANYHKQSLVTKDMNGGGGTYSAYVNIVRAFTASLQRNHVSELGDTGFADVRNTFLQRLETAFGKPGDPNSLDTALQNFTSSLEKLTVSPEDYSTRALTLDAAQTLAQRFNSLSGTIQDLRRETETQIGAEVNTLNQSLLTLQSINNRLSDKTLDQSSRLSVLDERDRLVTKISEIVDTQVTYRADDTVALMTRSGLGLLDQGATTFSFEPAGSLSANSLYDINDANNGVGVLTAYTPSGLKLDVVDQKLVQSGRLAGLINMRDVTLPQAQAQLDTIAAGITQALNTNVNTVSRDDTINGVDLDLSNMESGDALAFSFNQSGQKHEYRVVNVQDNSKLPMNYVNADGERVIGVNITSGGAAAVAAALQSAIGPGLTFSANSATSLRIADDNGVNTLVTFGETRKVASGPQDGTSAINLFTDAQSTFTNSFDGTPQIRGYASRIAVGVDFMNDNRLLVQTTPTGSLGDATRASYLLNRMDNANFTSDNRLMPELGNYSLSGSVAGLVTQVINYQGDQIQGAKNALDTQMVALDAVEQRMSEEYGVDVDEEMARLMELQNSYAASARVVSVAQELINSLLQI